MKSIVITPKNNSEMIFIADLLKKLKISSKVLSEQEKEDLGLALMMKGVDRSSKVSRETVMNKLRK